MITSEWKQASFVALKEDLFIWLKKSELEYQSI